MSETFLFLGTGDSTGVPVPGCHCSVCESKFSKNKRLRTSGLLQLNGKNILIDASPDFRQVAIKHKIDRIDAVLLTHFHEDHVGGLNDLRSYYRRNNDTPIPLFLSPQTFEIISLRFSYLMSRFEVNLFESDTGVFNVKGIPIQYFSYQQVGVAVAGFRLGEFAYVTDIKEFNPDIYKWLDGIKLLVLSAIHEAHNKMHFSLEEALMFIEKVRPKKTFLTHISHEMDHKIISPRLPRGVKLAYDGMQIDVR